MSPAGTQPVAIDVTNVWSLSSKAVTRIVAERSGPVIRVAPETRVLTRAEYRDLRTDRSEAARHGESALYQRCQSCGHCEYAGGFCSWCRSGDYVLEAHLHSDRPGGQVCPFAGRSVALPTVVVGFYHHSAGLVTKQRHLPVIGHLVRPDYHEMASSPRSH